jgi:hypothetical protein
VILTDTSVWIDHLRAGVLVLANALEQGRVLVPPLRGGRAGVRQPPSAGRGARPARHPSLRPYGQRCRGDGAHRAPRAHGWGAASATSTSTSWRRPRSRARPACGPATAGSRMSPPSWAWPLNRTELSGCRYPALFRTGRSSSWGTRSALWSPPPGGRSALAARRGIRFVGAGPDHGDPG